MELRYGNKLTMSSRPYSKGCPLYNVESSHRRIDSIERRIDVLACVRVVDM